MMSLCLFFILGNHNITHNSTFISLFFEPSAMRMDFGDNDIVANFQIDITFSLFLF